MRFLVLLSAYLLCAGKYPCKQITDCGKLNILLVAKGDSKDIVIMIDNRIQKREHITKSEEVQIDRWQRVVSKEYPDCYNIF